MGNTVPLEMFYKFDNNVLRLILRQYRTFHRSIW